MPSIIPKTSEDGRMISDPEKAATFTFTTGKYKAGIDKLYNCACDKDEEVFRKAVNQVANDRLARDCERLRNAGIDVDDVKFAC